MLSHAHSDLATVDQLNALPFPEQRGPQHRPVPHGVFVAALKEEATARGFTVGRGKYAIARHGHRLFGVMELTQAGAVPYEDRGLAIGFRNSTDESMAMTVIAGVTVFVCDNRVLSGGSVPLYRRNTSGLDLPAAIHVGFDRFIEHAQVLNGQIGELQGTPVSDDEAKARLYDLFNKRVLPLRLFSPVERYYFRPTDATPDCQPRTLWGVHNACTRALKQLHPARAFTTNMALGQAFGLHHTPASSGAWS